MTPQPPPAPSGHLAPGPSAQLSPDSAGPRPPAAGHERAYLFWQHEDEPPHALVGSLVTLDEGMTMVRADDEAGFVAAVVREMAGSGRGSGDYVLVRRPDPHAPAVACPPCRLDAR